MKSIISKLTVLFDDPFWIGLFECECENEYSVCKIIFGSEPKDCEVYEFILKKWNKIYMYRVDQVGSGVSPASKHINPKRMQRIIKKQIANNSMGTKAQQTLKLQRDQNKSERRIYSREKLEEEKNRKFNLKQQKRKQKHRGH